MQINAIPIFTCILLSVFSVFTSWIDLAEITHKMTNKETNCHDMREK